MEYKVGDKVMVREDLEVNAQYSKHGIGFACQMRDFLGKTVEIIRVRPSMSYAIKEDGGNWNWTDEMFAGLAEATYMDKLHEVVDLVCELSEKYCEDASLQIHKKDSYATFFDYDTSDTFLCVDLQTDLDKFITDIKEHFAQFEVKEMTVAEIEKQLGHAVKIVGE
ncbi:hypothetical protein ACTQ6A_13785 [Lachnospiraceae bacterium LCP25S3_G4]